MSGPRQIEKQSQKDYTGEPRPVKSDIKKPRAGPLEGPRRKLSLGRCYSHRQLRGALMRRNSAFIIGALFAASAALNLYSYGQPDTRLLERARALHKQSPLIDGHNDYPW